MNALRRQVLALLSDLEAGRSVPASRAATLRAQLAPRKRKVPVGPTLEQDREGKRAKRNAKTAAIRVGAEQRAGGLCEAGDGPFTQFDQGELDHFDCGTGKSQRQTLKNCWFIHGSCHRARTHNRPSTAHWNGLFRVHCERHSYPVLQRIEHQRLAR